MPAGSVAPVSQPVPVPGDAQYHGRVLTLRFLIGMEVSLGPATAERVAPPGEVSMIERYPSDAGSYPALRVIEYILVSMRKFRRVPGGTPVPETSWLVSWFQTRRFRDG
ncbi:MAG: hypothetical protein A4E38_00906 [Methanoregulaceae archaeon PtaB.Bin108]|nr:MAG: hypothetical protein A4E38_00906 [Methanoregulaceae archaeon PtaB.Bin108]